MSTETPRRMSLRKKRISNDNKQNLAVKRLSPSYDDDFVETEEKSSQILHTPSKQLSKGKFKCDKNNIQTPKKLMAGTRSKVGGNAGKLIPSSTLKPTKQKNDLASTSTPKHVAPLSRKGRHNSDLLSPDSPFMSSQLPGTQYCEVVWDCNSPGFTKEELKEMHSKSGSKLPSPVEVNPSRILFNKRRPCLRLRKQYDKGVGIVAELDDLLSKINAPEMSEDEELPHPILSSDILKNVSSQPFDVSGIEEMQDNVQNSSVQLSTTKVAGSSSQHAELSDVSSNKIISASGLTESVPARGNSDFSIAKTKFTFDSDVSSSNINPVNTRSITNKVNMTGDFENDNDSFNESLIRCTQEVEDALFNQETSRFNSLSSIVNQKMKLNSLSRCTSASSTIPHPTCPNNVKNTYGEGCDVWSVAETPVHPCSVIGKSIERQSPSTGYSKHITCGDVPNNSDAVSETRCSFYGDDIAKHSSCVTRVTAPPDTKATSQVIADSAFRKCNRTSFQLQLASQGKLSSDSAKSTQSKATVVKPSEHHSYNLRKSSKCAKSSVTEPVHPVAAHRQAQSRIPSAPVLTEDLPLFTAKTDTKVGFPSSCKNHLNISPGKRLSNLKSLSGDKNSCMPPMKKTCSTNCSSLDTNSKYEPHKNNNIKCCTSAEKPFPRSSRSTEVTGIIEIPREFGARNMHRSVSTEHKVTKNNIISDSAPIKVAAETSEKQKNKAESCDILSLMSTHNSGFTEADNDDEFFASLIPFVEEEERNFSNLSHCLQKSNSGTSNPCLTLAEHVSTQRSAEDIKLINEPKRWQKSLGSNSGPISQHINNNNNSCIGNCISDSNINSNLDERLNSSNKKITQIVTSVNNSCNPKQNSSKRFNPFKSKAAMCVHTTQSTSSACLTTSEHKNSVSNNPRSSSVNTVESSNFAKNNLQSDKQNQSLDYIRIIKESDNVRNCFRIGSVAGNSRAPHLYESLQRRNSSNCQTADPPDTDTVIELTKKSVFPTYNKPIHQPIAQAGTVSTSATVASNFAATFNDDDDDFFNEAILQEISIMESQVQLSQEKKSPTATSEVKSGRKAEHSTVAMSSYPASMENVKVVSSKSNGRCLDAKNSELKVYSDSHKDSSPVKTDIKNQNPVSVEELKRFNEFFTIDSKVLCMNNLKRSQLKPSDSADITHNRTASRGVSAAVSRVQSAFSRVSEVKNSDSDMKAGKVLHESKLKESDMQKEGTATLPYEESLRIPGRPVSRSSGILASGQLNVGEFSAQHSNMIENSQPRCTQAEIARKREEARKKRQARKLGIQPAGT